MYEFGVGARAGAFTCPRILNVCEKALDPCNWHDPIFGLRHYYIIYFLYLVQPVMMLYHTKHGILQRQWKSLVFPKSGY